MVAKNTVLFQKAHVKKEHQWTEVEHQEKSTLKGCVELAKARRKPKWREEKNKECIVYQESRE
jgi:hypothetical protein